MSLGKRNLQPILGPTPVDLIREDHPYRRLLAIVPFETLCAGLSSKYSKLGRAGYPAASLFKALLLQWMEDLSDRELERFLQENVAGKFFCDFGLTDKTPDHTTFWEMRERIGVHGLAQLFNMVRDSLKDAGLVREVFTFVDATHLISKASVWKERDRMIAEGESKLNNANIEKFAVDKDAKFGRKSGTKWYGFKLHAAVDMSQGLITRIVATPANIEDEKAAKHVMPRSGMVLADKAYCVGEAKKAMAWRGLHSGAILRTKMKGKNPEKDRWLSGVRMPFESTFSKFQKRARYRGTLKCQFQGFMEAFAHNMKRLVSIGAPPLQLRPHCA